MQDYIIFTDSAADIAPEVLAEWGVSYATLTFRFQNEDREYSNSEMPVEAFYDRMRAGGVAKTAAVNTEAFYSMFDLALKDGKDLLYLGFSSGLSTTYNSARLAAEALAKEYPDRKIITVDTLCASAGQGMLIYLVTEQKKKGADIEAAAEYARALVPNLCHWFTVDDLVYLKRGGRVSPTAAFVGNMLGIKPVLHVDNEGHLISKSKVRGRKSAILALAQQYGEKAIHDERNDTLFISHAACLNDAEALASILKTEYNVKNVFITNVGPVIGAHSGPGTLALFFVGKER